MLMPSTPTTTIATPLPILPASSSQSAAGTHTSAAPTTGISEQNAITTPQNAGAPSPEQPEREAADGALSDGDEQAGADAGDHEVAGVAYQALALRLRQRQAGCEAPGR